MTALDARPAEAVERDRLAAELAEVRGALAALLATDPGPVVTLDLARRWAADAEARGYVRGWDEGRLDLVGDERQAQIGLVRALRSAAPPDDRWRVPCGNHRRGLPGRCGPRGRCERRDRATFGQPHPDDRPGGAA